MAKTTEAGGPSEAFLKEVEKAFDALEAAGEKVTVNAVRNRTGGSLSKLCPAVRMVRERRAARQREAAAVPEMPDAVQEAFEAAWAQTYRLADDAAAAARRSFAEEIDRKAAEIEEREAALAALEAENGKLEAELKAAREAAHEAKLLATKLEGELGARDRDLAVAIGKLEERDLILTAFKPEPR